jgi:hypothetical protein
MCAITMGSGGEARCSTEGTGECEAEFVCEGTGTGEASRMCEHAGEAEAPEPEEE